MICRDVSAKDAVKAKKEKGKRSFGWQGMLSVHVHVAWLHLIILNHVQQLSKQISGPIAGSTKRSPKDHREPEGLWRDNRWSSRRRGMEGGNPFRNVRFYVLIFQYAVLPVVNRLHLMRERMSFLLTLMAWRTQRSSSQHQTDQEGWVAGLFVLFYLSIMWGWGVEETINNFVYLKHLCSLF